MSPDPPWSPPEQFRNIWTLPNFGFETSKITVPIFHQASFVVILDNNSWLRIYDCFHEKYQQNILDTQLPIFSRLLSTFPVLQKYFRIFQTTTSSRDKTLCQSFYLSRESSFPLLILNWSFPHIRKSRKNS